MNALNCERRRPGLGAVECLFWVKSRSRETVPVSASTAQADMLVLVLLLVPSWHARIQATQILYYLVDASGKLSPPSLQNFGSAKLPRRWRWNFVS